MFIGEPPLNTHISQISQEFQYMRKIIFNNKGLKCVWYINFQHDIGAYGLGKEYGVKYGYVLDDSYQGNNSLQLSNYESIQDSKCNIQYIYDIT